MEKDRYSETHVTMCVQLSPGLYKQVKDLCIAKKLKLKEVVSNALRDYMNKQNGTPELFPNS